ncbi:MAG: hypothetical protein ABJ327_00045 [Litoreibacter sp.]
MLKDILTGTVFAGVAAGVIAALLQFWMVAPALMEGELFETGAPVHLAMVLCTTLTLGLIVFGAHLTAIGTSIVMAPLLHIVGAPHLDTYFGVATPELSAPFVSLSLGNSALCGTFLGFIAATFWVRTTEV